VVEVEGGAEDPGGGVVLAVVALLEVLDTYRNQVEEGEVPCLGARNSAQIRVAGAAGLVATPSAKCPRNKGGHAWTSHSIRVHEAA
jgi:hypothetical protein